MNYRTAIRHSLVELLNNARHLRDTGEIRNIYIKAGICSNLSTYVADRVGHREFTGYLYDFIENHSKDWPGTTGNFWFPVDTAAEYSLNRQRGILWTGERLDRRISLMEHMLTKLPEPRHG